MKGECELRTAAASHIPDYRRQNRPSGGMRFYRKKPRDEQHRTAVADCDAPSANKRPSQTCDAVLRKSAMPMANPGNDDGSSPRCPATAAAHSTRAVALTRGPAAARPHRGEGQPALRGPDKSLHECRPWSARQLLGGEGSGNWEARANAPAENESKLPLEESRGGDGDRETTHHRVDSWGSHKRAS